MAYQTGTSTGPTDLLDKLRVFLLAQGWTVNDYSSDGTGYRLHVQISPESGYTMYFNFRSAIAENIFGDSGGTSITGIGINASTGYDAGEDWDEQPGFSANRNRSSYAGGCVIQALSISAIPSYYFFTVGDSVHVVVEGTSGEFQFMSFGMLAKEGVYTGGAYFSASYPSYGSDSFLENYGPAYFSAPYVPNDDYVFGYVYVDADSVANWRMAESDQGSDENEIVFSGVNPATTTYDQYPLGSIAAFFVSKAPNFYNNIASTCPVYTFLDRGDGNTSLIGYPEGIRIVNTLNYSMGQEITYGSETWKVFRAGTINGIAPTDNIYCGFAFKKVT